MKIQLPNHNLEPETRRVFGLRWQSAAATPLFARICNIQKRHGASLPAALQKRAFTLVEMLLVVTIIGILAALVIPKIAGTSEHSRIVAAQTDIRAGIKTALDHYEIDNGFYPKSLNDLLQPPSAAKNWHGPYFDPPQLPIDPWGNPYVYYFPGKHNPSGYDLLSVGPDGKEGGDDDIGNWPSN